MIVALHTSEFKILYRLGIPVLCYKSITCLCK